MKYNSIVFREFTQESIKRIANERAKQQSIGDDHTDEQSDTNKQSDHKRTAYKPKPDKELAVGEKLPHILQRKFPLELIGKPIEEIDHYYRTEYVCIMFQKDRITFFLTIIGFCGHQSILHDISIQYNVGFFHTYSIQLPSTFSDTDLDTLTFQHLSYAYYSDQLRIHDT